MTPKKAAVIMDRDGTLASCQSHLVDGSTGTKDWDAFNASLPLDAPVPGVATLFRLLRLQGLTTIITTGRMEDLRWPMSSWLLRHDVVPELLLMRPTNDYRLDSIVKREMYERFIEPYYTVVLVVDDRPQVVEMWREIGLPVIAVTDPKLPALDR